MKTVAACLTPYSALRYSGAEWLGDVPEHWELRRTKTLLIERTEKGHPNEPLLAATQTKGVVRKERYESRTVLAMKDLHLLKLVLPGDFVISLRSFQGGIEYARDRGIISPAYTVLFPAKVENREYLARLFKSAPYVQNLSLFVTGIRQGQNIDYAKLARSRLPLPPIAEQKAIVRFLDRADLRILRYIRTKERLIELLEEQKRAIIRRSVTGQIDIRTGRPYPAYRDSGVEWLGTIPAHWDLSRVKTEFHCLNRRRVPLSGTQRGAMRRRNYDYYGASGVIDRVDDYLFDDELLLIAEDGANLVLRNLPLAIVARGKFWVNNHAHILKPKRGCLEFLANVMESLNYLPWISGAAQPKLTQDRLMGITIAVPPRREQDRIVASLAKATTGIDSAVKYARQQIGLLREYRTRLIADIVTGKVDVRKAADSLPARNPLEPTAAVGPEARKPTLQPTQP